MAYRAILIVTGIKAEVAGHDMLFLLLKQYSPSRMADTWVAISEMFDKSNSGKSYILVDQLCQT